MKSVPLTRPTPLCSGTVIVHRDETMTCTSRTCPRHLPQSTWFSIHSSFVSCRVAAGAGGCPDCAFEPDVVVDMAAWRRRRYAHHPSAQDAVVHHRHP